MKTYIVERTSNTKKRPPPTHPLHPKKKMRKQRVDGRTYGMKYS